MVDTESLKFLQNHGFDFNLHVEKGIKYSKGNDNDDNKKCYDYIRQLFIEISVAKVPIVLHNGLIDLIFLYENFYANCPNTLMKFVADLSEIFPSGIFDTKYIVDFFVRYSASYLEYLFLKT
jgi:target of EGR1 protein 1